MLEAIISLTILAILGSITVSNLNHLATRTRDEALRTALVQLLNHARRQADILQRPITLCKSADQQHCGGKWSDSLLLFVDDAEDGVVHETSQILSVTQQNLLRGELHARFFPVIREYMQFHPLVSAGQDNGSFWYCHEGARLPVWAVVVNKVGGVRVVVPDGGGEIKDGKGNILYC